MSKIESSLTKFEVEKFNGKENFSLWQKRLKALLVQQGLPCREVTKHTCTSNENWEMDLKAANTI